MHFHALLTGLRRIGEQVHNATMILAKGLQDCGHTIEHDVYFDTLKVGSVAAHLS